MSDQLADRLAHVLGVAAIDDLVRLSGGASRETWKLSVAGRPLIAQVQRAGDTRSMATEVAALRAAAAAGVPVAEVVAADVAPLLAGEPWQPRLMVLEHVDGETIARKILRDERFSSARDSLPAQFGTALARLHTIAIDDVPGLAATDQLQQYRDTLDLFGAAHPTFELAFRWLEDHRPESSRRCVVHGDFRLGNVMVDEGGLAAVLDWELVHIGDPMEDLGWLCVKAWRFGATPPVAGIGRYEQLCDAYERASGVAVDPDVVRWWEVLGTLKWGIMCIGQAQAHLSGTVRSHELAAIGRRVCENEYDLFLALEGRW